MNRPVPLYGRKKKSLPAIIATNVFCALCVCLLVVLLFNVYLGRRYAVFGVVGRSMQNTLQDGDYLYTDERRKAERGDIVIIDVTPYPEKYPRDEKKQPEYFIIKRLIAVEGDSLYCENGVVYLKKQGETEYTALDEPYAYLSYPQAGQPSFGGVKGGKPNEVKKDELGRYGVLDYTDAGEVVPVTVGEGEIFFLGDHRDLSTDARAVGCLKTTDIAAVVPEWAIEWKWYSTGLENFRTKVLGFFGF